MAVCLPAAARVATGGTLRDVRAVGIDICQCRPLMACNGVYLLTSRAEEPQGLSGVGLQLMLR